MAFRLRCAAAGGLGVALIAFAGCASGGADAGERNDAQRYLRLGRMQLEQAKTMQAIESLQKAIDLDPKLVEAYNLLGLVYLTNSEIDKAIGEFEEAVRVDPYFTDARNNLGIALRQDRQYDRAAEQFQAALKDGNYRSPEKIHLNVGYLYLDQGRHREAIDAFRRALEIDGEYLIALIGLGRAYAGAGRPDLAEEALAKVVLIAPDSPEAARARRMIAGQAGQDEQ
jgi:type IV pilus biogenesis/stability protein PilW